MGFVSYPLNKKAKKITCDGWKCELLDPLVRELWSVIVCGICGFILLQWVLEWDLVERLFFVIGLCNGDEACAYLYICD